jgi:general secretion pathway protein D
MNIRKHFIISVLFVLFAGCASLDEALDVSSLTKNSAFIDGQKQITQGNYEVGLRLLEQAMHEEPKNNKFRAVYMRKRDEIFERVIFDADRTRLAGNLNYAEQQYNLILVLDFQNARALEGLEAITLDREHIAKIEYAKALLDHNEYIAAEKILRAVLQENQKQTEALQLIRQINSLIVKTDDISLTLSEAFKEPLTIEFKDIDVESVFKIISQTVGINFVFDKDVKKNDKVYIFVQDNSMEDILKLLTVTNKLNYKTLNDNTLLIYPDTPAKKKEYQELIVRSFHVAYTEVKQMVTMVRGLVKAKDIYVNEKLNLFIIRDTPEAVNLVARLVSLNDLPEPEVMLEVEILEVKRDSEILLGPNLPQSVTYSAVAAGVPGLAPLSAIGFGLKHFSIANDTLIDFKKTLSTGDILANPRIRVRNREVAKILIGERVPVVTSNVTGTAATVTQQVNYIDVGLKLDVSPIISLSNEVAIKISFEVSTIISFVDSGTSSVPQVGTRTAETVMTLKDGETQVLAGLINEAETKSFGGLVGLMDLPLVSKLFTSQNLRKNRTEIILLVTPRIIRNIIKPTNLESQIQFGTANSAGRIPVKLGETADYSIELSSNSGSKISSSSAASSNGKQVRSNNSSNLASVKPRIILAAPKNIALDQEFSVRASLVGVTSSVTGEFEIDFDTNMLELVNAEEGSKNKNLIKLGSGGSTGRTKVIRFKVIAVNPGSTEITVNNISAKDSDSNEPVEIDLPKPSSINIK